MKQYLKERVVYLKYGCRFYETIPKVLLLLYFLFPVFVIFSGIFFSLYSISFVGLAMFIFLIIYFFLMKLTYEFSDEGIKISGPLAISNMMYWTNFEGYKIKNNMVYIHFKSKKPLTLHFLLIPLSSYKDEILRILDTFIVK